LSLAFLPLAKAQDAKPKTPTYLTLEDARKDGPDIDLQGEYSDSKLGVQVIALGNDTFRAVVHNGGLPGQGWDKSAKVEVEAKRTGDAVEFNGEGFKARLTKDSLSGENGAGKFNLPKVNRQSATLGAKPPAGAVVLFDGSNCDAFVGGHFDELNRNLLASGSKTKQADFQNFTLHVEFLLPFKPLGRGQDRANSGVYMQDRYEVQVLDSFGLKGLNNECGGIYSKTPPALNMCLPPLVWQTYDIDFAAAKFDAEGKKTQDAVITVRHNDVLVHDKVAINGPTGGGKKEDPTGGAIQLQGHGNPVCYRNVWIVPR
jgi:hypothetical protein